MKRLFLNGNALELFFAETSTFDDIFEWVQEQVMFQMNNIFDLNEQHSCSVNNGLDGSITIYGDEDSKVLTIEDVKTVILTPSL